MVRDRNTPHQTWLARPCGKVLLVEDSLAEARLIQEILKSATRFELVPVQRLCDAIAQLHSSHFDVVLLDLTLPDSTGLDSVNNLTAQFPSVAIVVLTNTNDDELALHAVRCGAQDYLIKRQLNPDTLIRSMRYAIERKQTSEALREANEILEQRVQERTAELQQEIERCQQIQARLELAQKAAKTGTFEWNLQTNEITWTAEVEALYGLAPGSFGGRYEQWIELLHPDDRTKISQILQDSQQTIFQAFRSLPSPAPEWKLGRGSAVDETPKLTSPTIDASSEIPLQQALDTEFRILHPDGSIHWISVQSSLVSQPLRMLGIQMDITEKKQLEAQFLRAQRLESLGTLAGGIAHDLNNILTPILSVTQLLPLKIPNLDAHNRALLNIAETSTRRGADLVKQILSFARGMEGNRVNLQLSQVLSEVQQIIQQTLPKSIEIQANIASDLWTVTGDATQIHQILMNLCVNARDAMPQGGTLTLEAENIEIDYAIARLHLDAQVGSYVLISVTDTGTGISPDHLHRIFDPFFTTKEIGKGTGLGLSALLGIVKSHSGFVDVQSEVNQGSRFRIYLPTYRSEESSPDEGLKSFLGQQTLVLVVDDESTVCETLKEMLLAYDYQVLVAQTGLDAIALLTQNQDIEIVFLDLMMPTLDGWATLPLLRRVKEEVCAIAMSGLASPEIVAQAEKQGFQEFLHKPFTSQDFLKVLGQVKCWNP